MLISDVQSVAQPRCELDYDVSEMTLPSPSNGSMRIAVGVLLAALAASGCKKKPGGQCSVSGAVCADSTTRLTCEGGRYAATACKGPKGCRADGKMIECDTSGNIAGDPCAQSMDTNGACSTDGSSALICKGGSFQVEPCRGPARCQVNGTKVLCDHTLAADGDACSGGAACTEDTKAFLECKDGKFRTSSTCKGPNGCRRVGDSVMCDASMGDVGDACPGSGNACSADSTKFLECKDGKLALLRECRGKDGCYRNHDRVECDVSIAELGDACLGDGAACSVDGKAMLQCKNGKLEHGRRCKQCSSKGDEIHCL